jgi:hypothetical protein
MVYPIDPPGTPFQEGPPWQVTPELYEQLLLPGGLFECLHLKPIEGLSHEKRAGREWLGRWRRRADDGAAKM